VQNRSEISSIFVGRLSKTRVNFSGARRRHVHPRGLPHGIRLHGHGLRGHDHGHDRGGGGDGHDNNLHHHNIHRGNSVLRHRKRIIREGRSMNIFSLA
jgi:hypothetical protein